MLGLGSSLSPSSLAMLVGRTDQWHRLLLAGTVVHCEECIATKDGLFPNVGEGERYRLLTVMPNE